jgi:flavin-dependent dehydrogenase
MAVTFLPDRFLIAFPSNGGQVCAAVQAPIAEFQSFRANLEQEFYQSFAKSPWMDELLRQGKRAERWSGTADLPNLYRKPFGPGWALVGDAGYHKDPMTAQGITDAFRDAELLAEAIDAGFSGRTPLQDALANYERQRNDATKHSYAEAIARAAFQPFPLELYAQRAGYREVA